ncbi:glycosyltransferase family 2 protein [Bacillus sp. AGMB 02131]|uniref:Glycosyltransferase family 2 protein n=1 Tax=Peribacillus faecalis TaxID=2772559 RepID=A0A927CTA5_9BACI|nr:glycosyltransferase family 2 protein [Peribacillus faecalis]MBD3107143.1 glycosyltransferase family 2 protein [Peribacillus faecalis]
MSKISVIVPVYNTGMLVKECLESLFNQTYKNYEIIIVNDGSNDDSEQIILTTIEKQNNCKYVYQENKGLSSARNTGLLHAEGEFISFVDSDDWVEKEFLEHMLYEIEKYNADICMCGYYQKRRNIVMSQIIPEYRCSNLNDESALINFYFNTFIENKYGIICCNKLYRKSLLQQSSLKFEKNREIYAEDLLFNSRLVLSADKIVEIPNTLYNYRIREGSITQTKKTLLETRYAELLRRIEPSIIKCLPKYNKILIALIQYEAINVIATESFKYSRSLREIYKTLKVYNMVSGDFYNRLEAINSAKKMVKINKKEIGIFLSILNVMVKTKKIFLIAVIFWLKGLIMEKKRNGRINS